MRAIVYESFGAPNVLTLRVDHPKPVRKPGECLVRVVSTSVNPVDWKTRQGQVPQFLTKLPKVPGGDVAGIVVESDQNSSYPLGTRVFACTDGFKLWRSEGSYCDLVTVPECQLAMLPDNTPLNTAGGLPLVCLTSFQALEAAHLLPGQRLLVHGGAGGVGSHLLQIAKARGLYVITTCSAKNMDFCRSLGADQVIDYTSQAFETVLADRHVHAVVDLIGGDVEIRSMRVLHKQGTYVNVLNSGWIKDRGPRIAGLYLLWHFISGKLLGLAGMAPKYKFIIVHPSGAQLTEVARLLESGALKPVIDHVLMLEQAAEGHAYLERGHARGKVILRVAEEADIATELDASE
jgi:NADPH:quinone reductase-like Zn-dependent oxidoreductase